MEEGDEKAFEEAAREMKMPGKAIESVWKGFKRKELEEEGRKEAEMLDEFIHSQEEFKEYITKMNPHSTGGISGLTYYMV